MSQRYPEMGIYPGTECCHHCEHYLQHYIKLEGSSNWFTWTACGHCTYPRNKTRRPTEVCEHFAPGKNFERGEKGGVTP